MAKIGGGKYVPDPMGAKGHAGYTGAEETGPLADEVMADDADKEDVKDPSAEELGAGVAIALEEI